MELALVFTPHLKISGGIFGKTFSILPILIDKAIKNPLIDITVIGVSVPHLKGGAMKDFIKIMKLTNRWIADNWNESNRKYTFTNGSSIEFVNADGDKAVGPRRNILYVNEANLISYNVYNQLAIRTSGDIYLDFNPTNQFWAHTEVLTEDDAELLVITYEDNEGLSEVIVNELLAKKKKGETSEYWRNWWRVYGEGQIGRLEGVIFQNWKEIDFIPQGAELLGLGLDWGYSNDVTAAIAVYKYNGKLLLDEIIYQKGLSNKQIANMILAEFTKSTQVYADSAEPKSIDEVRSYGVNIQPTKKGPDSINYGISLLQEYDIEVTKRSYNLKMEFEKYIWKIDKEGNSINQPIDNWNHAIDATRYLALIKLNNKSNGVNNGKFISF